MKFFLRKQFVVVWAIALLTHFDSTAQSFFRSVATGNWNATATWEMSPDNITWGPATYTPTYTDYAITIQSPNAVTVNASVSLDELTINLGASLVSTGATVMTINDGSGVDIIVNGTFNESATSSIAWTASATWQLASNGTLIRTQNTSSNFWQQRYIGGIATIPATANWIIRKIGGANPSISTTAGIGGAFYPNLTIENNVAGIWNTATSSTFQGSSAFATIKGNWDIGGSGTSTVNFLNQNTNAQPTRVIGNVTIRAGNILSNYGTGVEVQGNLTVNGTIQYDAADLRTIDFAGGAIQTFSGTGTANIWSMRMRKTANNLTLGRAIKVNGALTFTSAGIGGIIFSTATNLLTIEDNATASGASNSSYVDGPVLKLGDEAFTFPVGKNNYYRMAAMGIATGAGGGIFWTENFNSGCISGCVANTYSGPNGAWTMTDLGPATQCGAPVTANTWYISCAESGTGAGSCGTSCGSTATLHVGNISSSPSAPFFCPAGDCGAAYDAGGYCGLLGSTPSTATDKRVESPTINCTGQSGISVSFNYLEFGQVTNDNATLWYYDGATWAQIDDMPKSACCGGACNGSLQGQFTARTVALPASANNNPNVKIAFRWVNDDDGSGTDPSFAVDDVALLTVAPVDSYTAEYFRASPQVTYNNVLNAPLDHISMCEYWTIVRNSGTQARTVTLSWDSQNSCGVTSLPDLRVAYFNAASWDDKGNGGTTGVAAAGTVITSAVVNNFGPFTLSSVTTQNPLPVYLVSFTAHPDGNKVLLNWTTSSEFNNDHFDIQSSASHNETISYFETIGEVRGNGNSTTYHSYSFIDDRVDKKGIYYYRLRQVDYDGKFSFSNIVAVNFNSGKNLSLIGIIPNPYTEQTSVQILSSRPGVLNARINDLVGREIVSINFEIQKGTFSFDPEESVYLSKGVYFVELLLNDERIISRLVKE